MKIAQKQMIETLNLNQLLLLIFLAVERRNLSLHLNQRFSPNPLLSLHLNQRFSPNPFSSYQ
uniref:Uncharacterized protein n=1 Tax=Arundo donax TaxID=35708 RepID=A0A0A8ZTU8_ARUDO